LISPLQLNIIFGQSTQRGFNVVDETELKIKKGDYNYYKFTIDPSWSNNELIGSYSEKKGNDATLTLYETSTCNAPDTSKDFDIDTCNKIFSENHSIVQIDKIIQPGNYYLKVEGTSEKKNVVVTLHFDIKYNLAMPNNNVPNNNVQNAQLLSTAPKGTIEYYCIQYQTYVEKIAPNCHDVFHGNIPQSALAPQVGCLLAKVVPLIPEIGVGLGLITGPISFMFCK
jgi:predicted  nucleic acid-binding Zn-ribbon protein